MVLSGLQILATGDLREKAQVPRAVYGSWAPAGSNNVEFWPLLAAELFCTITCIVQSIRYVVFELETFDYALGVLRKCI